MTDCFRSTSFKSISKRFRGWIMSAEGMDAKNPAYHSRADAALLENLFDRLPWTLAFNLIIALCTLIVFSGQETWSVLLLWFAMMVGTIVLRLHVRHSFLQRVDPLGAISLWRFRAALGAAASGAAWGIGGVVFYDTTSTVAQVYWPFVLAGMSAGSMVAQIGCIPAFVGFVFAAISPYALRLAAEGDLMHLLMAGALALYMVGISFLGRSVNAYLMASIRLTAENERLAERLAEKTRDLAEQNAKLEHMVAVRTDQLEQALSDLRHSEANRRRMLADVSHELRTPLTIIQGEADVALRGVKKTPVVYREALVKAKEAAVHTAVLVDDLLFIARSESGYARLRIDDMDLKALLSDLAQNATHPVPFITDLNEASMLGDASRVRQVVLVLLQNAQQYGAGAIMIRLDHGPGGYRIAVEDEGPGMSDMEKKDAFQRFFRGFSADDRYPEGTGLGLPVARAIVEAHGGTISLEDRPGGGLISIITLPMQRQIEAAS